MSEIVCNRIRNNEIQLSVVYFLYFGLGFFTVRIPLSSIRNGVSKNRRCIAMCITFDRFIFAGTRKKADSIITPENVFQIGSMTKQFTAIAIVILEQQGKLNVTDPFRNTYPIIPTGTTFPFVIYLTHTSGIKDFTTMKSLSEHKNIILQYRIIFTL